MVDEFFIFGKFQYLLFLLILHIDNLWSSFSHLSKLWDCSSLQTRLNWINPLPKWLLARRCVRYTLCIAKPRIHGFQLRHQSYQLVVFFNQMLPNWAFWCCLRLNLLYIWRVFHQVGFVRYLLGWFYFYFLHSSHFLTRIRLLLINCSSLISSKYTLIIIVLHFILL